MRHLIRLSLLCLGLSLALSSAAAAAVETKTPEDWMLEVRLLEAREDKYREDLQRAQVQLDLVTRKVEEGQATMEDMNAAQQAVADAAFELREHEIRAEWLRARAETARAQTQKVSLDVQGAPLAEALKLMFEGTAQSFVLSPEVGENKVTIALKEVPLNLAVDALCDLYNLDCTAEGNLWTLVPRQGDVITIDGRRVPVVAAMSVSADKLASQGVPAEWLTKITKGVTEGVAETRTRLGKLTKVEFPGSSTLIDLEVEDAALSEVVSQLSAAVNSALEKEESRWPFLQRSDEATARPSPHQPPRRVHFPARTLQRVDIVAHESLRNVRVTAKIYRWPAGEVLGMLIEQTGVVYAEEFEERPRPAEIAEQVGAESGVMTGVTRTVRIHLVPRPVLEATGPGIPAVPGGGGGGGRSGGGGGGGGGTAELRPK